MNAGERVAVVDVGTNTVLLTVAERRGGSFVPVVERAEITRLGRGVDRTGVLDAETLAATVEVVARYAAEARALGASRIAAVATSAARDARNGAAFFEACRARAGVAPEIIPGGEEARLVHLSAWGDFGAEGARLAVLDVGGGSSEVTWGAGPVPEGRRSFQMGAVRLTERVAPADPPSPADRARLEEGARGALAELADIRASGAFAGARLVAVAGTVTTLAAVEQALPAYDALRVHGAALGRRALGALVERLAALPTAGRAALPGMEPKRADVILAGAVLVAAAMDLCGFDTLTVSDRGVRWGLLHDRFGEGAGRA
ncbi:MAG TPA: Ppx/GppA family phosphatase [Anaeromyxobacteraceae bacterium]|nr:Ppx/GppA family phosphatase [Anaeromyxobacteraceae bacterium]